MSDRKQYKLVITDGKDDRTDLKCSDIYSVLRCIEREIEVEQVDFTIKLFDKSIENAKEKQELWRNEQIRIENERAEYIYNEYVKKEERQ